VKESNFIPLSVKCRRTRVAKGSKNIRSSVMGADGSGLDKLEGNENLSPQETSINLYLLGPLCLVIKGKVVLEGKRTWKSFGYRIGIKFYKLLD
jgi:hypothetical protein